MLNVTHRVATSLLGILALVVVADLGLRSAAPFKLYRGWEHPIIGPKEGVYEEFGKKPVDVLIIGSSLSTKLDAKRMGSKSKQRVFNGSIPGLLAAGITAVLSEAYLPIRKPRLIIYPLSMRDIRKRESPFDGTPFLSHRMRLARAATWQEIAETSFEKFSYLFRVRRQIRHTILQDEREQRSARLDAHGSHPHSPHRLEDRMKNGSYLPGYYKRLESTADAYDHTADAKEVVKMIKANKRLGIKTVLVNMAISPAALSGKGKAHYKRYLKAVKALAEREGVALHDALGDLKLSDAYFDDLHHVGAKGDKKVEDYLIKIIDQELSRTK